MIVVIHQMIAVIHETVAAIGTLIENVERPKNAADTRMCVEERTLRKRVWESDVQEEVEATVS